MVYRHNVRACVCYNVEQAHEAARRVRQAGGEFDAPVPRDEAELYDPVDEADVDVAAGEQADGLAVSRFDLPGEDGGKGARARGLYYLLRALHSSSIAAEMSLSETVTRSSAYFMISATVFSPGA